MNFLLKPFFVLLFLAFSVAGQTTNPECSNIKYLDFFGLRNVAVAWPESEIDGLLKLEQTMPAIGTDFLIPMIVTQIAVYRSGCSVPENKSRFDKLVSLYIRIRRIPPEKIAFRTQEDQVSFLVSDFYSQVEDDRLFPHMMAGFDDGPLYGKPVKTFPKGLKSREVATKFGNIRIGKSADRIYVEARDARGKSFWVRVLTGAFNDRILKNYDPAQITMMEYDAASVLGLVVDGERLRLYTRPDGKFIFYSHSW